jgi:rubredoxin
MSTINWPCSGAWRAHKAAESPPDICDFCGVKGSEGSFAEIFDKILCPVCKVQLEDELNEHYDQTSAIPSADEIEEFRTEGKISASKPNIHE